MPFRVDHPDGNHHRRQLDAVANNATLALFIMDERQHCTYMNPAAERLTGYTLDEVRGRALHDVIHHTHLDGRPYPLEECPIDQAFPQNMREAGEEVFVHRDGHFYPVAFTASPILDDGQAVGTIIEVRDITAEKREEADRRLRLRESALTASVSSALTRGGSLQSVLQSSAEALVEHLDAAFARIWTLNEAAQVLELQASAGLYTHRDGPHSRIPVGQFKIGAIAQERVPHLTNDVPRDPRVSNKDWARREGMIAFAGYPLLVEGRTVGVLAMFARHTLAERTLEALGTVADGIALAIDRSRLEEARNCAEAERERFLRELEAERTRLQTVFHQAPAFIATLRGPDHVFEMANPPYYQLVGHREVLRKPVREALPEVVEQGFVDLLDQVFRTGEPFVGNEVAIFLQHSVDADPDERFLNFVYQPLTEPDGSISGILVHGVDVTQLVRARQQAEEQAIELEAQAEELQNQASQLEEAQSLLEAANFDLVRANREAEDARLVLNALYDAAPLPIALVDPDLRFERINEALAQFYGRDPGEVIGKTIHEVVPQYAARVEPYYRQVLETGQPVRNVEISVPDPSSPAREHHFLLNYFPVRRGGSELTGVGFLALDVTERHQLEEGRREQIATVETLHEVGQALTSELGLDRIVQVVTDAATSLTGAQFGAFFYNVVNDEGAAYTLYSVSGVPREAFSHFPMPRATPIFHPTFHGTGVVRSDDITRDPRYGLMAPFHGMPEGHLPVTSYLAVPVISRSGGVLGGLFFGHETPGVFKERHERLAVGIAGWAAVAMDNSRLYEAEHRARAEAQRANRVKSEFLATMSHELRTPLNAMIGYSDLLLAGVPESIPDGAQQKVERIRLSASHLLELIEEILTFSRLEAGEEKIEIDSFSPATLLKEVQALTEPLALKKGIELVCHVPDEPRPMESDSRKIRQILINLVGNAAKFTDQGQISLALELVGAEVVFKVSDTGAGIAAEHLERIFAPFVQIGGGMTRTAGGTGLGLSVTRRLARLLGGDITVESTPGAGSTFTVRLPRTAPRPPDPDASGGEDSLPS